MKSGFLRNLKYIFYFLFISLPQIAFGIILLYFYSMMSNIKYYFEIMAMGCLFLLPLIMSMQNYMVSYKNLLGFCSTRNNFFLAGLVNKLFYALFAVLIAYITGRLHSIAILQNPVCFLLIFSITMFCGMIGEFYGIMMQKYGKWGLVIYIVSFCAIIFSSVGVMIYFILRNINDFTLLYSYIINPVFAAGVLIACTLVALVNRKLLLKTELKI